MIACSFTQMKRSLVGIVFFLFSLGTNAQTINIGLFCASPKTNLSFVPQHCHYLILADTLCLDTLKKDVMYSISSNKDSTVNLISLDKKYGKFKEITLTAIDTTGELKFKASTKNGKDKYFTGDFKFKVYEGNICVYNYLDLERYIEAVIESESGLGHTLEYYKVQAVISRTYARSNAFKHIKEEGFNLCDNTHCQAYKHKGKSSPTIVQAVRETRGIVMVDDSLKLITAAFHSNCGGQTCNSEQVWSKPLPYLRSVSDSYCSSQLNAYWQKQMSINEWLNILKANGMNVSDSACVECATHYSSSYRQYALNCGGKAVPFKTLRAQLKLKSAFFNVTMLDANTVTLQGRGFGHGVGLCQEGAMKMAKAGKSYKEILTHYFTGIHVINLDEITTFTQE